MIGALELCASMRTLEKREDAVTEGLAQGLKHVFVVRALLARSSGLGRLSGNHNCEVHHSHLQWERLRQGGCP